MLSVKCFATLILMKKSILIWPQKLMKILLGLGRNFNIIVFYLMVFKVPSQVVQLSFSDLMAFVGWEWFSFIKGLELFERVFFPWFGEGRKYVICMFFECIVNQNFLNIISLLGWEVLPYIWTILRWVKEISRRNHKTTLVFVKCGLCRRNVSSFFREFSNLLI